MLLFVLFRLGFCSLEFFVEFVHYFFPVVFVVDSMSPILVNVFPNLFDLIFELVHFSGELSHVFVKRVVVVLCLNKFSNQLINVVQVSCCFYRVKGLLVLLNFSHGQMNVGCIPCNGPASLCNLLLKGFLLVSEFIDIVNFARF